MVNGLGVVTIYDTILKLFDEMLEKRAGDPSLSFSLIRVSRFGTADDASLRPQAWSQCLIVTILVLILLA
ncbi:hypothetical protein L484_018199 [Morus notabilis]|uniref:Uncharacterized protein n=1 Tax=Morus notabilis TaxID=981085 RepID=W9QFI7_9ROSA|nr:hypothetical protein L484_018199 [Morus notabilis]